MKKYIILLLFIWSIQLVAQEKADSAYYWISFTDKMNTPYSIEEPEAFLSPAAIDRRQKFNIPITESDLPVNDKYLLEIKAMGGKVHNMSKWMNAATILLPTESIKEVQDLSFVKEITYVGKYYGERKSNRKRKYSEGKAPEATPELYYGYGTPNIETLNGDSLHLMGYTGNGMHIGVLDGGFINIDTLPFFDSLRLDGRMVYNKDFVDGDDMVFESSSHGTSVLSVMASDIPGVFVGTGPDASYTCLKTEDVKGEYKIEECNMVAALEYADSLGVDVINVSLGYYNFNDSTMDYTYKDMDGMHAISSRGIDMAFKTGMIVVTSAGNEGNGSWKYISAPADAINALSVGAIGRDGERANFSSFGPTSDGRTKPDVAALGSWVAVASSDSYSVGISSGTSISSPIMTGLVACLWQAFPNKSNKEITDAIRRSAHQYIVPDAELGYGIPDFMKAYRILQQTDKP